MLAQRSLRAACRTPAAAVRVPMQSVRPSQRLVVRRAQSGSGMDAEELQKKASEVADQIKDKWEKTEDKGGAIVVVSGTILALSIAFSVVNAIDKIPVVSDLIELVGVGVTGWFTYRYITVGPDGDELFVSIRKFIKKVYNF